MIVPIFGLGPISLGMVDKTYLAVNEFLSSLKASISKVT
jgi:hypothetical protein